MGSRRRASSTPASSAGGDRRRASTLGAEGVRDGTPVLRHRPLTHCAAPSWPARRSAALSASSSRSCVACSARRRACFSRCSRWTNACSSRRIFGPEGRSGNTVLRANAVVGVGDVVWPAARVPSRPPRQPCADGPQRAAPCPQSPPSAAWRSDAATGPGRPANSGRVTTGGLLQGSGRIYPTKNAQLSRPTPLPAPCAPDGCSAAGTRPDPQDKPPAAAPGAWAADKRSKPRDNADLEAADELQRHDRHGCGCGWRGNCRKLEVHFARAPGRYSARWSSPSSSASLRSLWPRSPSSRWSRRRLKSGARPLLLLQASPPL